MSVTPVPFFEMFTSLADDRELQTALGGSSVVSAEVNTSERNMSLTVWI